MLPLPIPKLPVIPKEPEMSISTLDSPDMASVILWRCSALITLPLCIPDVLIVAIYCDFYLPRIVL